MPVERTKRSRRDGGVNGVQLTWTTPVEPSTQYAFAPNVTPGTFNESAPSTEAPAESTLFPPPDATSSRRPGHTKKKPDNHIPRPPNAFILFRSAFIKSQHVSSDVETNHSTLSKIIGLTWQNLPHEERQVWHAKAKAALDEHKRRWPEYAFRPLHTKGKGTPEKRKVREVGPKDLKRCAKIAELLVQGKKGHELDEAVHEFDKYHVPHIVTRFEAPITARTYRRSSSAPAPDTEHSKEPGFLEPSSPNPKKRSLRACSTQPTFSPSSVSPAPESEAPLSPQCSEADVYYDAYQTDPSPNFTFSPSSEPAFDFSSFTFTDNSVPAPITPCDPLTRAPSMESLSSFGCEQDMGMPDHSAYYPSDLSINTSFVDSWSAVGSPIPSMPGTPQCYSSMQPSPCGPLTPHNPMSPSNPYLAPDVYTHAAYCAPFAMNQPCQSFDNSHTPQQYYDVSANLGGPTDMGMPYYSQDLRGHKDQSVVPDQRTALAHLDMDLSSFMQSIHSF